MTVASVANTEGPPALVTIANLGPFGRGCLPKTEAIWNNSEMLLTLNTPALSIAASKTSSLPASEPV